MINLFRAAWRQKLHSFSALTIWLLFLFSCCRPFASAGRRLLLRQEHRKAKSWRDRWRLISKQRIGRLLKAESPMDFSPFDTVTLKDVNGKITAEIE